MNSFFKSFIKLAIPISIQNLLLSSLTLIDNVMIGSMGDNAIASVAIANQLFFFLHLILFGLSSGASAFIAQFYGSKDYINIKKTGGIIFTITLLLSVIFFIISFFFPDEFIRVFTKEKIIEEIGVEYIQIVGLSIVFASFSFVYSIMLRAVEKANISLYVSVVSIIINTVFNYLLIYGNFGFPKLGVKGAAIATLLARIIEFLAFLITFLDNKNPLKANLKTLLSYNFLFFKKVLKTIYPVILNEMFWAGAMVTYRIVYARMSIQAITSLNIISNIEYIAFFLNIGVANAAMVMIGKKIGEKDKKLAFKYALDFIKITVITQVILGIIIFLTRFQALRLFNVSNEVIDYSTKMLTILSIAFIFKGLNNTLIVGIFRSGGDTKFSFILEASTMWFIGVFISVITGLVLRLNPVIVYLFIQLEDIVKLTIGLFRVNSKKWINDLTNLPKIDNIEKGKGELI